MNNLIYPCLWFNHEAKAAAMYYSTIFPNFKILDENEIVVVWELNGTRFMGLNGGPHFKFNEAVSFVIECANQEEIDHYWDKLTADGGAESMCGWCKDKYGVSWQVVPQVLGTLMSDPNKRDKVVAAFMQMKKFDIQTLIQAANG